MLHHLLEAAHARKKAGTFKRKRKLSALILAPTRELALQVTAHLNNCLNPVDVSTIGIKQEEVDSAALSSEDVALKGKKRKGKTNGSSKATEKDVSKQSVFTAAQPKGPPLVSVAAIVGGMSAQKQRRILDRGLDILVATPGRLWDILQEVRTIINVAVKSRPLIAAISLWQDDELANQTKNLRFLVLDEADRMIETGHFAELDNILRLTLRKEK